MTYSVFNLPVYWDTTPMEVEEGLYLLYMFGMPPTIPISVSLMDSSFQCEWGFLLSNAMILPVLAGRQPNYQYPTKVLHSVT